MEGDNVTVDGGTYTGLISIHTFRVEGDDQKGCEGDQALISIHTFRVEGDDFTESNLENYVKFQSTPSVWKVTMCVRTANDLSQFQSTPSVWKVTRV